MNIFSTDGFLDAVAEVRYRGQRTSVENFEVEGRVLRTLAIGWRKQPLLALPYLDFLQPLDERPQGPVRRIAFAPRTVLDTTLVEDRRPEPPGVHPSPYIEWGRFSDWAGFEAFVGKRIGNLFPDSRRKRKKLERDVGPIEFVFDDQRPEAFERCIAWKSAQYRATQLADLFEDPRNVELFRALRRRGLVVVSTLWAGGKLLSVHLGGLADARHYWWVPAYDPAFSKYSPGRLMLENILQESLERRHREFDFLIGDEAYKFHYATHNRVVGPLGEPPLHARLRKTALRTAKSALERYPAALDLARKVRRRLQPYL